MGLSVSIKKINTRYVKVEKDASYFYEKTNTEHFIFFLLSSFNKKYHATYA